MAATVDDASSSRSEVMIRETTPPPPDDIERWLLGLADGPTASAGWRVIHSWPSHGVATQPALTIVNDSSSMLRNLRVTHTVAPWVDYVSDRLSAIAADPAPDLPRAEVINRARSWIMHLLPPSAPAPAVLPSEGGGIDFVWHRGGWNVEIGVEPDGTETVWTWNRESDEEVFGDLEEHRDFVIDLIRALTSRV
jgi:hypothetical protein